MGEEKAVDECHPTPPSYLDIPVLIQVIDTSDAAPVTMGIVNVSHVPQPVSWVTCHHGLAEMMEIGFTDRQGLLSKPAITSSFSPLSAPHLSSRVLGAPSVPAPRRFFLAKPLSTRNLSSWPQEPTSHTHMRHTKTEGKRRRGHRV